jgi:quercetin dioxygenase-like cupin family protein
MRSHPSAISLPEGASGALLEYFFERTREGTHEEASALRSLDRISGSGIGTGRHEGDRGHTRGAGLEGNPNIPKGGQVAILVGDPAKAGDVVVQRVKLPPNYQVPPHTHPYAETVTLISGSVGFGMGEKFDNKGALAKPGTLFANPAKHAHYVWTGPEEAIVQVQFIGPGGIDYINPADDPRKKTN